MSDIAGSDRPSHLAVISAGLAVLASGAPLDGALTLVLDQTLDAVDGTAGAVFLQDPDHPELELAVTSGLDEAARAALLAAVGDGGHPVALAARDLLEASDETGRALPLIAGRDGIREGLGAIWLVDAAAADAGFLASVADLVAVAADRARLAAIAAERADWFERLAHTDPLTGLANARTFGRVLELELARAARQGGQVSVAIFDVDDFTRANAESGRPTGDDILRAVASVLAGSVRLVDTVARYGGDEFILVAPGSAGVTVARRVLDGVAALPEVAGRKISVSAGVAQFPNDGTDADAIVTAALEAIERARAEGRGGVETTTG